MKKLQIIILFLVSFFTFTTASAGVVLTSDFNVDDTMGWKRGINSHTKPTVKQDAGNYYLEVESFGHRSNEGDTDSRMVFFNKSSWSGDYSNVSAITTSMKNIGDTPLQMRIAVQNADSFSAVSSDSVELAADGLWHDISFNLSVDDMNLVKNVDHETGETTFGAFTDIISNVNKFQIMHATFGDGFWGTDEIVAKIGVDDIQTIGEVEALKAVPLPGAAWLMISGLLSLGGFSSYKRSQVA